MPRSRAPDTAPADACAAGRAVRAGRPRQDDVALRTRNLLGAAARLFLQHGYAKVSLEAIARDAHVAVRTIYVKFGGKAGLFNAVIAAERERFLAGVGDLEHDLRPVPEVLADFGACFLRLVLAPHALRVHRIVVGEVDGNPDLARTYFDAGPAQTRQLLDRYFARPDVRAQFRADLAPQRLTIHLLNCLLGDQLSRLMFGAGQGAGAAEIARDVALGLDLFLAGVRA